jgi:hypothetical protein
MPTAVRARARKKGMRNIADQATNTAEATAHNIATIRAI